MDILRGTFRSISVTPNTLFMEGYVFITRIQAHCDACRRRKSKCDGELTCSSCTTSGLDCSYGSQLRSTRGPAYVAHLEKAIKELEERIGDDANSFECQSNARESATSSCSGTSGYVETLGYPPGDGLYFNSQVSCCYGGCSVLENLRRMRLHLDSFIPLPVQPSLASLLICAFDRPLLPHHNLATPSAFVFSPAKSHLLRCIGVAFEEVLCFWPTVDRTSVEATVCRLYTGDTVTNGCVDHDEVALVYAIVALGEYFNPAITIPTNPAVNECHLRGIKYFQTARSFTDLTNCGRNMVVLQTVMCMAIYLVAASAMSTAHALVLQACGAAQRLGLHLPVHFFQLSEDEGRIRDTTYRSLRALDIHVATLLGLPCCLPSLDGEPESALNLTSNTLSRGESAAAVVNLAVLSLLSSTMKEAYFSGEKPTTDGSYTVPSLAIQKCNNKLNTWRDSLFGRAHEKPNRLATRDSRLWLLIQHTISYVQMVVNAPFLHHLSLCISDQRSDGSALARQCITAAVDVIELLQLRTEESVFGGIHPARLRSLALAATALLIGEFSGAAILDLEQIKMSSSTAEMLLRNLASRDGPALQCFQSLKPLYRMKERRKPNGPLRHPEPTLEDAPWDMSDTMHFTLQELAQYTPLRANVNDAEAMSYFGYANNTFGWEYKHEDSDDFGAQD